MASSTSSSVPTLKGGCKYDVFLSFRGEDTRYKFVDFLYDALSRSKMLVFKDDEKLREGTEIRPELLEAIKGSTCAVVVLSKNYANSSWCLAELAKIMECRKHMGQLVIPVFYHVDPSDARGQKRDFDTAFKQLEQKILGTPSTFYKKFFIWLRTILIGNPGSPPEEKFEEEMDKVNEWRKALTAVSNLSGQHMTETGKVGESAIINKIVRSILDHIQPPVNMEKNLIGIKSHMNELESLLDLKATEKVRIVGIWGMGGIGKTTIARALFTRISCKFHGSSFLNDVRENGSNKRNICALQERILKDITDHEYQIRDPEEGAELIKIRFSKQKVLLVFDDVNDVDQLEFLPARHEWFSAGSRIIITTRDMHVLSPSCTDANSSYTDAIYKPPTLPKGQAIELFSRHAFQAKTPPKGYEELSDRAICYTGGLPLALKVLGSHFHGEQASVWDSALNRLAKRPEKKIYETLKISFDGLCDYDKEIFLDIACFFKGDDKESVTRKLDSFGLLAVMGINVLTKRSLITVSSGHIHMHDVLQEMGWEIVRESYPNSRLWQHEEIRGFKINKNPEAVKGIVQTWRYDEVGPSDAKVGFSADVFETMKNIRLLDIHGDFTSCKPTTLPNELRWLRWNEYRFSSLPEAGMDNLVGLEMHGGKVEHLWRGYKFMPYLKFIHLEHLDCIESSPDVSGAPIVERLTLSYCINLVEVHESLGTLRKLAYLNMSGCWNLKRLLSIIDMPLLETIDLSECFSLENFPEVSSGMEKLSNIYLNGCSNLKIIPRSICKLKSLKSLHLQDCDQLPEDMGSMKTLEELQLGFRDHIMAFQRRQPESINFHTLTKLCYLRKLDLCWRPIEDADFFNNLDGFSSLEELHLTGNWKLVQLPASISRLSRFKHLELNRCRKLQNIQGLPSGLQVLKASDCIALEKIEDLTKEYVWLHKIWLHGCDRLLENQENERYLDNMLQQSFLKKCAALDHVLSIAIPGNKIPSWFEEQRHGNQIALKLPPKCHTDIMGFVVCGVFQVKWPRTIGTTEIHFGVEINRMLICESKVDYCNESAATENESVWIAYIPFGFSQQQTYDGFKREDWSLSVTGNLIITSEFIDKNVVRCGAHIMYKEDVESVQQLCIPDYRPNSNIIRSFDDSFIYREKHV
ncbi:hypothetical protein L6452_08376 [Arctium lappa]|uniref:Uncharacterized protein n=1 Tax=Arctium lappa TaxID=4217 RepID=A0ACB9DI82_ARCLA|nr:hypothetical protein L6452_08376 [Arctium lappa]